MATVLIIIGALIVGSIALEAVLTLVCAIVSALDD